MKQTERNEGHIICAELLGWNLSPGSTDLWEVAPDQVRQDLFEWSAYKPCDMLFSYDWNWLMIVVDKIFKHDNGHLISINFYPSAQAVECKIYNNGFGDPESEHECEDGKISVFKAVVEWIKFNFPKQDTP